MVNPTHLEHIGKNIKDFRKFRNMTQQQLADEAGVRLATTMIAVINNNLKK
jgi:transcriptional regulator with XRE-family HTH domain